MFSSLDVSIGRVVSDMNDSWSRAVSSRSSSVVFGERMAIWSVATTCVSRMSDSGKRASRRACAIAQESAKHTAMCVRSPRVKYRMYGFIVVGWKCFSGTFTPAVLGV